MWYPQSAQKGNNLNAFTARNPIFLTVWRELILLVISGTSHARDSCLVFGLLTALNSWLAMSHEIWWQSNRGCLDIPLDDRATWRLLCEISRTERGLDTPFRVRFFCDTYNTQWYCFCQRSRIGGIPGFIESQGLQWRRIKVQSVPWCRFWYSIWTGSQRYGLSCSAEVIHARFILYGRTHTHTQTQTHTRALSLITLLMYK